MARLFKFTLQILLGALLAAAAAPQLGDLVELDAYLNARNQARFRNQDDNKIVILPKGARAQIQKVQYFPKSGNYGIQIRPLNVDGLPSEQEGVWVYYNKKDPGMKLYSMSQNETDLKELLEKWGKDKKKVKAIPVQDPNKAQAAEMTRPTKALKDKKGQDKKNDQAGSTDASDVVGRIQGMNDAAKNVNPSPVCRDCDKKSYKAPMCTAKNNYLEESLDRNQGAQVLKTLLSTTPRYSNLEACVRESMNMSGGNFAKCGNIEQLLSKDMPKACASDRLVKVTQNAFTIASSCLSGYLNNSGANLNMEVKKETMRQTLALVNLESGFHVNVMSPTGASGLGQITTGAIKAVNNTQWNKMMEFARKSSDADCQILNKLALEQASPSKKDVCERMSFEGGNPLKNMIYTIGHMKMVRSEIEVVLNRKMKDLNLTLLPNLREELIGALTVWGHNTGSYGITRPLTSLFESKKGQEALKNADHKEFLRLLKAEVSSFHVYYMKGKGSSDSTAQKRAKEASTFLDLVNGKMNTLEKKVGRSCKP